MTNVLHSFFKHHFKTTLYLKDADHEDECMIWLFTILKQINTSLKSSFSKRYTLREEEFETTTYRRYRKENQTLGD